MKYKVWSLLIASLFAASCTGGIGDGGSPGDGEGGIGGGGLGGNGGNGNGGSGPGPIGAAPVVPTTRLARLSHSAWEKTARDLLKLSSSTSLAPLAAQLAGTFTGDASLGRFDNNGSFLQVTIGLRGDYQRAAESLAQRVTADPAALARIVPAGLPADAAGKARGFIEGFGRLAYRRPLTNGEITRYLALFNKAPQVLGSGDAFADGVRVTLEAFLQSPHFLYRTELATGTGKGSIALGPYEVAAKLSYTLADTMPDSTLMTAAQMGQLDTRDKVRAQAERLLATAQGGTVVDDFHGQLLHTSSWDLIDKKVSVYPEFVSGIVGDMKKEAMMFTRDVVLTRKGGLKELLLSPTTFVNKRLAAVYKVPGTFTDTTFQKVDLDPAQRAGVLTQIGYLSYNAYPDDVDSIHRGVFVHRNILCTTLPPPIDNVSLAGARGTTERERITSVTGPGTCGSGCHSTIINPVGFAFQRYDGLGRHRTTDRGKSVDSSGMYDFGDGPKAFNDALDFSRLVSESRTAHDCYARGWMEYLHARIPQAEDETYLAQLTERSRRSGAIHEMILELVTNDAFLKRAP